jgi:adenine phosphoribosyltransferase
MFDEKLLRKFIVDVPDFPQRGVVFRDLTPLLRNPEALRVALDELEDWGARQKPNVVAGIEARGFVLGAPVAARLSLGFVPIRKPGKLPRETIEESYSLEYGSGQLAIHRDAAGPGDRVLLIDDLLATGGTAAASVRLLRRTGAEVVGVVFLVELTDLSGRRQLGDCNIHSLVQY